MRILLFGGTTEGRKEALRLHRAGEDVTVCVTSDYAAQLLPEGIRVLTGAMDGDEMRRLMARLAPELVVDATHPYALRATENIRAAAGALGIPLRRIARPQTEGGWRGACRRAGDAACAAALLAGTQGNVLLTTGSHTLGAFAAAADPSRLYARVLPTAEALSLCAAAGIPASHVIAMQGPFSRALNAALYDQLGIAVLVTKDGGREGGVEEKVLPALERGIGVILIERPEKA